MDKKIDIHRTTLDVPHYVREYKRKLGEGKYGETWLINFAERESDGDGEVIEAALKILKPLAPTDRGDPITDFLDEIIFLRHLRHPGVVRILRHGECKVSMTDGTQLDTLYYIAEYEAGVRRLSDYLTDTSPVGNIKLEPIFLVSLMKQLLPPLAYCHEHSVLHLDLHPDNILVKTIENDGVVSCSYAVLIDFGKAKLMHPERLDEHEGSINTDVGGGAYPYKHPFLRPFLKGNRVKKGFFDNPEARRFDLYSVAICLREVYQRIPKQPSQTLTNNLLDRVLNSLKNEGEIVSYPLERALETLVRTPYSALARDSGLLRLSGQTNVSIEPDFFAVIGCPEFQRLRRVYQLSFTHMVYPSATHNRFSHSIGAFHLCGRYLTHLFRNSADFQFEYDADVLRYTRLGALIHDIGHYPFAHYFEELGDLGENSVVFEHENYGQRILKGEIAALGNAMQHRIIDRFGENWSRDIGAVMKTGVLRDVVKGPIDCDKVDYLLRDGQACGVPYADSIDLERLLSSLTCVKTGNSSMTLEITPKGIAPVESIINARYHMFSEVYWHKTCRAVASMVKHAMYLGVISGTIKQTDLDIAAARYGDWEFLAWLKACLLSKFPTEANDLISQSLLEGSRKLYKRVITIPCIWDRSGQSSAYDHLEKKALRNYQEVVMIQKKLTTAMNEVGKKILAGRWKLLADHELLLDVPPVDKDILYFPKVYYENDVNGQFHYDFVRVSAVFRDDDGKLLKRTQKIRLFAHPDKISQMQKLPNLNQTIRDIILGI